MFFQKPNSLFLCRFWNFELHYPPIVLPSSKSPPIEMNLEPPPPNKPSPIKVPALSADTYIEIQPALSPSAARGRNQILFTGDGRALSAVSFQCSCQREEKLLCKT